MHNTKYFAAILSLCLLAFTSCDKRDPQVSSAQGNTFEAASASEHVTDKWVGQWNGPEGTFLRITGSGGNYEITIQNLDGQLSYAGVSVENEIQFERNSIKETIQATNGEQTGMKWLSDKTNCLTIHTGEGYCKN